MNSTYIDLPSHGNTSIQSPGASLKPLRGEGERPLVIGDGGGPRHWVIGHLVIGHCGGPRQAWGTDTINHLLGLTENDAPFEIARIPVRIGAWAVSMTVPTRYGAVFSG
jgi:hypothetical protein